jgi:hypothetical protein
MDDRCGHGRVPGSRAWPRGVALLVLGIAGATVHAAAEPESPSTRSAQADAIRHDADGRAYRIERVAKAGAKYERIDAHTVRYFPFARYEVEGEDPDYFYVKQYLPVEQKPIAPVLPAAASVDLPRTNRFALRDFGRGLPHAGQWRGEFALADVDGDGHLDLAFAPPRKSLSKPVILRGDGQGEWTRWTASQWPALPYDYGAAVAADFDADGHVDLAFAMHLRGLAVLGGDGKGGFVRRDGGLPLGAPGSKTPATYSSHQLGTLDWNGDRRPDLIALDERLLGRAHPYGSVAIFVGGRGAWKHAALPQAKLPRGNLSLARIAGGRGDRAIVIGDAADGRLAAFEFAAGRVVARVLDGVPAGALLRAGAAADAGDGKPVLAIAYQSRTRKGWQTAVDLFRRQGEGYVREPLLVELTLTIGALAYGHLASARAFDLAALRSDGALLLFAADGKGSYTRDREQPAPSWRAGCSGHALHLRDLDGDGRDEIVAAFAGEPNAMMFRRDCTAGGGIDAWHVDEAPVQR